MNSTFGARVYDWLRSMRRCIFALVCGDGTVWKRQSVLKRCYFACGAVFFLILVGLKIASNPSDPDTEEARKYGQAISCAVVVGLRLANTTQNGPHWVVLMEQRVVKNWLRSTPNKTSLMAWPGEYAFPGGAKEPADISMQDAAKRELQEELLGVYIPPSDFHVRLFDVIKVKGFRRRYQVHIFIAFASMNHWLQALQIEHLNENLERRMNEFNRLLSNGEFWDLSAQHKMYVSPEVHRFEWMPLRKAFAIATNPFIEYVNEFQHREFVKHKVPGREKVGEQMIEVLENLLKELEPMTNADVFL
mmetsp:Transcript_914/g.2063  ORF Transcript_914/g.2063 Transcript_914/m.2063 type:complete len:304 (-) Transcript_914:240-1151(-)